MKIQVNEMNDASTPDLSFSPAEREAVYRAIFERRDMRHFTGGTVAPEVMRRLLTAAPVSCTHPTLPTIHQV